MQLALYSLVIAVRHRVVVHLLVHDLLDVVLRQRCFLLPQLLLTVRKVTSRAPLTTKTFHKVLANIGLELHVQGGEH